MAVLSFTTCAVAMAAIVHGAALPQSLDSQTDAPSCLNKAQDTTFTWSPANNEDVSSIFDVSCGNDYYGGDLSSLQTDTFQGCLEACSTNIECVAVAYGGTSCYLKSKLMPAMSNSGVWSAKRRNIKIGLTCDSDGSSDGKTYTSSKGDFKIVCGKDYWGNDLTSVSTKNFESCIEACATTDKCVDVSYVNGACYLKHTIATPMDATQVWSATLVGAKPFVAGLSCENNKDDKKTYTAKSGGSYTVECSTDYWGGDLSALDTSTFEACMDACDSTTGCIDVSYSSGRCYMKDKLNTASAASWVWTGRKSLEKPLDLTQTTNAQSANILVTKEANLFSLTLTGSNQNIGVSTMLRFPTKPYTVYEISFEYFQEASQAQGQSYFLEVGDSYGYLATLWWAQNAVGSDVVIRPSYSLWQMNSCWTQTSVPKKAPASGGWQSGTVVLYPRSTQGYFRRDISGLGNVQWRNVYVREKSKDYCSLP